jgi:hypothetical protein
LQQTRTPFLETYLPWYLEANTSEVAPKAPEAPIDEESATELLALLPRVRVYHASHARRETCGLGLSSRRLCCKMRALGALRWKIRLCLYSCGYTCSCYFKHRLRLESGAQSCTPAEVVETIA